MKIIHRVFGKISLLFYLAGLYDTWRLCQYGWSRRSLALLAAIGLAFLLSAALWLISGKAGRGDAQECTQKADRKKKLFRAEAILVLAATVFFGARIIYAAIPYNGAISWVVDEWLRARNVKLEHDNFFQYGAEGVLEDLDEALDLPEELYISNRFQMTFDENGTIRTIYTFLYGQDTHGETRTYLVDYDSERSENMRIWLDGNADSTFEEGMRLEPMLRILQEASCEEMVRLWALQWDGQTYEILYMGRRSFDTAAGLQYLPGDVGGDGVETGAGAVSRLASGGRVTGYEVSLHIPEVEEATPVRYIMEPEYTSREEVDAERAQQQSEAAMETEGWTTDPEDGGASWQMINEDPFGGQIGVTEGLVFYDENFGIAGLEGASQAYSRLYVTRDGGKTFTELVMPMEMVTELPANAEEYGYTMESYAYLHMPEQNGSVLTVLVSAEKASEEGLLFRSEDCGETWEYAGTQ